MRKRQFIQVMRQAQDTAAPLWLPNLHCIYSARLLPKGLAEIGREHPLESQADQQEPWEVLVCAPSPQPEGSQPRKG